MGSRREQVWADLGNINPEAKNIFSTYTDPFSYGDMSGILDKLYEKQAGLINRNAANTIQRGQKDTAARLAAEGITGGSVYNSAVNKVVDDVGSNASDVLEQLGIARMGEETGLMKTANDSAFRIKSADQNVLFQNIANMLNKNRIQQQAVNDWEQFDLMHDNQPGFLDDIFSGLSQLFSVGTSKVNSAGDTVFNKLGLFTA